MAFIAKDWILKVFHLHLLTPYEYTPKLCQMKDLIIILIRGRFHEYSICGCEIKNFQSFSYWFSIHEMGPFWWFLYPYSPKYCSILVKFWPEVVSNKKNTLFENYFKILHFSSNGMYPKSTVFGHFGAQFTPQKPEKLLKPKISAKTASLELSNNINCRSQKTHIVLVKLIKIPFLWPKMRINFPPGVESKGQHISHIAYSIRILPQFIHAKFPCLTLYRSWLTRKIPILFFRSGLNWAYIGRFGGNNSNKKRKIRLKFGPWIIVQMSCKIFWKTQSLTEIRRVKNLHFWWKFDPNLPPEDG